jgi:hypothetical protein
LKRNVKLDKLEKAQTTKPISVKQFYRRVVNKTDITFTSDELSLLNKALCNWKILCYISLQSPRQVKFVVPTAVNIKIAVLGRSRRVLWEMHSDVSEEPAAPIIMYPDQGRSTSP